MYTMIYGDYTKHKKKLYIEMDIAFFSGEKTEKATPKKRTDARKEGQVAQSQEIGTAANFIFVFFSLTLFAGSVLRGLTDVFYTTFDVMARFEEVVEIHVLANLLVYGFSRVILVSLPILLVSLIVGVFFNLVQVGWAPTTKPIMPKLSKLNPLQGIKKIFSVRSLVEFVKSLLKLTIILLIVGMILMGEIDNIAMLISMPLVNSFSYVGSLAIRLGITVGGWFVFIAGMDYAFQKHKHEKDLKMSKQDIKDEYKQSEGNPQVKGKIRQKMREASMRRMMQDIPRADVVITNPTHYAVAISYDRSGTSAPKVVGKGVDHLAKRIRDLADEHKITRVENVQLARALYASVDIGREIPPELYKAVAEVLAYVYRLKNQV